MTWRIFGVILMITGIGLFVAGVWVEFEIQAEVGTGIWKFMAETMEKEEIDSWRRLSVELMIAGPLVYFVGHLLFHVMRRRRQAQGS